MDIEQIIKNRYKELPENIQQAIKNTDLASKFNTISEKHNLHLDQNGNLQTETILVMLGLEPTNDYVDNIQKSLEISKDEALSIARDINIEILDPIKDSLRILQEDQEEGGAKIKYTQPIPKPPKDPSTYTIPKTIEEIGNFSIEKSTPPSSSSQYNETNINREETLKSIEDKPITLVDHLLSTPVSTPQKVEIKNISIEKKIIEEKKPDKPKIYSEDPYRESII